MRVWPGRPYPLGATWDGAGVNFSLFSEHATKVELCLFESPEATQESHRIVLPEHTDQVWHAYLPDVLPEQLYGYRVHGPFQPERGHRFNPHKIVLDPYAKAIGRDLTWDDALFGYQIGDPRADLSSDERGNAAFAPLAAVIDPAFTWGDDQPPLIPWHQTLMSQVKLIAEPWDVGPGGYQVGNFPVLWTELNGKYRDNVRRFWKGDGGLVSEFATRLCGSSDLYEWGGRRPYASINFITYDDPAINALRERQKRNLIATLLLSQGVPMLCGGDELSHTQKGNNNAYCQDNEVTWLNWDLNPTQQEFLGFVQKVTRLWADRPVFQRRKFFQGRSIRGSDITDVSWFEPSGKEMSDEAWNAGFVRCLGVRLAGDRIDDVNERGEPITDETVLMLLNAHHEAIPFALPVTKKKFGWECLLDTSNPSGQPPETVLYRDDSLYALQGRSLVLLGALELAPEAPARRQVPNRQVAAPSPEAELVKQQETMAPVPSP